MKSLNWRQARWAATLTSLREDIREAARLFTRTQAVTIPMVTLFAIIPGYLVIGVIVSRWNLHSPALALDLALPLVPEWSVVYGSLFCAALLPVFIVHQQELVRRVINAYLTAWLVAFAIFLLYPTRAPPHPAVTSDDFSSLALRLIYGSDMPYNCFPSLHVAQCYLAAFAASRLHRGVAVVAFAWATLVALSTLFTKQHYVVDVIAGTLLAYASYWIHLRAYPLTATPESERRLTPILAAGAFATYGLFVAAFCVLHKLGVADI